MLTSTLGGLIKDYRIKKRLSQLEVSLRIGWKDTSRLSKIEQGRVSKPTRETLDKIMAALELDESEKGQMLLVSNTVPTKDEVRAVLDRLKDRLAYFDYPVLLVDFAWNVFYMDKHLRHLLKMSDTDYRYLEKNFPNWLEMLFLRKSFNRIKMRAGYREGELKPFEEFQVAHFKFESVAYSNEKWFRKLLSKLSVDSDFRKLWAEVPPSKEGHLLYEYEFDECTGNWRGREETLRFHVFSIHPTFDFRFYLMVCLPADENTHTFYLS